MQHEEQTTRSVAIQLERSVRNQQKTGFYQNNRKSITLLDKNVKNSRSSSSSHKDVNNLKITQQQFAQYSRSLCQIAPIIITLCLAPFYLGYVTCYFGALNIQVLMSYYKMTMSASLAQGLLNGLDSIGAALGCILVDPLLKYFSRKNSIQITNITALIAGALIFIPNQQCVLIMSFIQGVCVGIYCTIVPLYIIQLCPINYAGTFGVFIQVFMCIGTFWAFLWTYIMSAALNDYSQSRAWFYVMAFPQLTILLQTVLMAFVYPYQTPKYFILKNEQQKTKQLLTKIYKPQYIQIVYEKLKYDILEKSQNGSQNIQLNIKTDDHNKITITNNDKFYDGKEQNKMRKTSPIAIFTAFYMSFTQQMVGVTAIVVYGGNIAGNVLPELQYQIGFIINTPQIITSLVLSYLLSKYGRKNILQVGMFTLVILNVIIAIAFLNQPANSTSSNAFSYIIFVGQFLFNAVYGLSVGSMLWVIMPAIVQPNIMPYSTVLNWISSAIILILFPLLIQILPNQNPGPLFIFFAIYTFISFLIYVVFVIQIKDKSQRQIYEQYNSMNLKKMICFWKKQE